MQYCNENIQSSNGIKWTLGDNFIIPYNELSNNRFTIVEEGESEGEGEREGESEGEREGEREGEEGDEKGEEISLEPVLKIQKDYVAINIPNENIDNNIINRPILFKTRFLTFIKTILMF